MPSLGPALHPSRLRAAARRARRPALARLLVLCASGGTASAADPPPGTTWSEHYFASGDGTRLHADVLRPSGVPADARTPVVLTVSPYLNHSGATTEYSPGARGPSDRFYDFLTLGKVVERGYTYVMVDVRGFGGSAGCNDWGGPGEQMDVKAAVEWAGAQPWSSGRVGVIGKSYDGWTGLMAIAQRPRQLAAVVSLEPVYAGYRYLYMNGVRFANSAATPALFTVIDAKPGSLQDDPMYNLNGASGGACASPLNIAQQQDDDPESAFWKARDLLPTTKGADTPLFLTQGFLETNTKPDAAFELFNALTGPKRAWFGQFDHVRGWERAGGSLEDGEFLTGRGGFIDEAMRFLDHHVKGMPVADAPTDRDPAVAVQGVDGRYRAEGRWPPADVTVRSSALRPGAYPDDGENRGTGSRGGNGHWTFSQPLPHDAHLAGEPVVEAEVQTAASRANLVANVYDVAPDGTATMVSRGALLLRGAGANRVKLEMYGQDWALPAGHRIGVLLSSANAEWWAHVPTRTDVTVKSATVRLPFLSYARAAFLDGGAGPRLRGFLASAPFKVRPATIEGAQVAFDLPPALIPAAPGGAPPAAAAGRPVGAAGRRARLTIRATLRRGRGGRRGRSLIFVRGTAPARSRLVVRLVRSGRRAGVRRVRLKGGARRWRARFRVAPRGRYRVTVTARTTDGRSLRASGPVRRGRARR